MSVEVQIISIGTLGRNRLWDEPAEVRPQHATTSLVIADERRILVDPSLPGEILAARLFERTGQRPETITDVFCTTLRPDGRRGIEAFPDAAWWTGPDELETYARGLGEMIESANRLGSDESDALAAEAELIQRFRPRPRDVHPAGESLSAVRRDSRLLRAAGDPADADGGDRRTGGSRPASIWPAGGCGIIRSIPKKRCARLRICWNWPT